ncbi:class I SAM-dependent methyltransferase [Mycolicibacillus parakoreensis]|uniref:Class I SAM-dependent methyltransferase n=1 Tax=Mycolicibacillus parakoreensis TaxID=1069221 RepID=A0ABY3TTT3_9MYCO|nr:methyltransferase domain-containing protein [Mycolicibacillus parakoreensis]MCV7316781.1 class I SAM-dependent methyltransferase [Mycolicibacillus parakoreensis]ULN51153.1 class I SAM-dependent methyltransferase [Mycolicibacillus parakoreensis]HLR99724.1 methyltransferase domain-containing protein [Mycolicibacillus parakoreensis]
MRFDELIAEAAAAPVDGWDFSWLHGRATEARPSWGYQRALGARLATVTAALDLQTGGGEVLAGVRALPATMAATEGWAPNAARATALLHRRGVVVVTVERPPLPFADDAFDLVCSRHPNEVWWTEIARVLRPGGRYFAQHVGPGSALELLEFLRGPRPRAGAQRAPGAETAAATAAGLTVGQARLERLPMAFFDIGAVVYYLRKVIWLVPDFDVEADRARLRALHERIEADGPFVAHATRVLVEAGKPG